jgi:hypothetical protein
VSSQSRWSDLNRRPAHYECAALPLSYTGGLESPIYRPVRPLRQAEEVGVATRGALPRSRGKNRKLSPRRHREHRENFTTKTGTTKDFGFKFVELSPVVTGTSRDLQLREQAMSTQTMQFKAPSISRLRVLCAFVVKFSLCSLCLCGEFLVSSLAKQCSRGPRRPRKRGSAPQVALLNCYSHAAPACNISYQHPRALTVSILSRGNRKKQLGTFDSYARGRSAPSQPFGTGKFTPRKRNR